MYKILFRPILFLLPPETVHHFVFDLLGWILSFAPVRNLSKLYFFKTAPKLKTTICGIDFPNKIGLAAGFDKNAYLGQYWQALGFGFVEIGTVTPKPQPGNPKPRLFRLPADQALINRMGFNNQGSELVAQRLKAREKELGGRKIIVGGNIGRNKNTPNELAEADYVACLRHLHPYVDYFAINVSSPNTPGLRALQEKGPLTHLIQTLQDANRAFPKPRPLFLKIAPDLNPAELDDIIALAKETALDGIIATNTTISRGDLKTDPKHLEAIGAGGLSGLPLKARSTEVIRYLRVGLGKNYPIIAAGGIHSVSDALEKLEAGADLVQIYTGLVYEGPGLVRNINKALATV
jgi:dihydroorotate dehydrogenase